MYVTVSFCIIARLHTSYIVCAMMYVCTCSCACMHDWRTRMVIHWKESECVLFSMSSGIYAHMVKIVNMLMHMYTHV